MTKPSSVGSLVFLREQTSEDNGLQRMRTWLDGSLSNPNTRYIKKLTRLRTTLTDNGQGHLSQTVDRLLRDISKLDATESNKSEEKSGKAKGNYVERQKNQHHHRQTVLHGRQKDVKKSDDQLEEIKGEKMIEIQDQEAPKIKKKVQKSASYVGPICERSERNKFSLLRRFTDALPTEILLKHTTSIPTLERKGKVNNNLAQSKNGRKPSFVRQASLHRKDERGLYKGHFTRRNLMRGDRDSIDLTPESFKFDIPFERQYSNSVSSTSSRQYPVPTSSPISFDERYELPRVKRSMKSVPPARSKPESRFMHSPLSNIYCSSSPPPTQIHPALLRTNTSIFTPSRYGYIPLNGLRRNTRRYSKTSKKQNSDHYKIDTDPFNSNQKEKSYDAFYGRSQTMFPALSEKILFVSPRSDDSKVDFTLDQVADANDPDNEGTGWSPQESVLPEKRTSLVVQMPNIVLNPPTPVPDVLRNGSDSVISLRRTFRQNELRQKEVADLLEDVKELTQIVDDMSNIDVTSTC